MAKKKITFDDIKIWDKVVTIDDEIGYIISINSVEFLNDKIIRDNSLESTLIDIAPFKVDKVRHKNVFYNTITLAIIDQSRETELLYVDYRDINEIKEVYKKDEPVVIKTSIFKKIKLLLKNIFKKNDDERTDIRKS